MIQRLPLTKARINLGQVVRRAHVNKEYFILEKDGIPVAAIMSADDLEDYLELQHPGIKKQIREGYEDYKRGRVRYATALLAELKSQRRSRKK